VVVEVEEIEIQLDLEFLEVLVAAAEVLMLDQLEDLETVEVFHQRRDLLAVLVMVLEEVLVEVGEVVQEVLETPVLVL
jgi:hypothetical protein